MSSQPRNIKQPEVVHLNGLKVLKAVRNTFISITLVELVIISIVFYAFSINSISTLMCVGITFASILIMRCITYLLERTCFMDGAMDCLIKRIPSSNIVSLND